MTPLIAPRLLFVESGQKDATFPGASSLESFRSISATYKVFGAEDRAKQEVFNEAHSFWGKQGIPFLARQLAS